MLADQVGKLKQVAPWICDEGDTNPHRNDIVRLGYDGDGALLQLRDHDIDIVDPKTHVMPSRGLVAIVKILVRGPAVRAGTRQKLEYETIVSNCRPAQLFLQLTPDSDWVYRSLHECAPEGHEPAFLR